MATLYRKYRPQDFSEVVGQNHIKLTLEHEISSNKIAHAYLFCGPRAVGKTTISRVFSKAVNCLNRPEGEFEPCNKCTSCNEINLGRNLDIIEIDAASHTGVDNVRDNVISVSRLAPSRSKFKVFIIDEVHMLSTSAFNALLKTLEEPPSTAIFILCTTEVHKIPATIISRCQRFDFKRISMNEIVKRLDYISQKEEIKVERSVLEAIARHSEGHMRDAESLFGQVLAIGGREISQEEADLVIPRSDLGEAIKFIAFLANKDAGGAIGLINGLINDGIELKRFTNDLIELLRKIMLGKVSPILAEKLGLELGENLDIEVNKISKGLELPQIVVAIERLMRARSEIKNSFIAQLPLEIAITELCLDAPLPIAPVNNYAPRVNPAPVARPAMPAQAPNPVSSVQTPAPARPVETVQNSPVSETPVVTAEHKFVEPNHDGALISRELLKEKWSEILIRVKKYNHSLPFILQVCDPRDVRGNQVCMAFKYKFHKERINDMKIREIMEKVLFEVFNLPLTVEAIIDEMMETKGANGVVASSPKTEEVNNVEEVPMPSEDIAPEPVRAENGKGMIDDLLKTFGGKVVG
ncbi:MAG: DNA polymerase III subunit gamma/tau [Candidatus Magasanikbacteria bacterium]|nr:DNA polymerase III subunit gamma/tau [Candidatus Magasanikbacteria bacterium]